MIRKEVLQFVTEDGSATRFEDDDGRAGVDGSRKDFENAFKILLSLVEHAEIVERAAAARLLGGNRHGESGVGEDVERRTDCFGMKMVVKSIHPQNNFAGARR